MKKSIIAFLSLFMIVAVSCRQDNEPPKVDFDREGFLTHTADRLIEPAIDDYKTKADELSSASAAFIADQDVTSLDNLRQSLKQSWLSYQYLAFLQVGPVASINLRDRVNIFPSNVERINENINSGSYVLGAASNVAAKGYPALDYLLFGTGESDEAIIAWFTDELSANKWQYLGDLVGDIQAAADFMQEQWAGYRPSFIENLGTDVGSGTSLLVNEFNFQFDIRIKNAKIGFPSGGNPRTGGILSPQNVEALYSDWSGDMAKAAVEASLAIFKGHDFETNEDGLGFDDYLEALDARDRNDQSLSQAIISQIQVCLSEMEKIDEPYRIVASEEGSQLVTVYNALQAVIPLIKVDMTSAMSVSITFQDNDGD